MKSKERLATGLFQQPPLDQARGKGESSPSLAKGEGNLKLFFRFEKAPRLDRAEFRVAGSNRVSHLQRGDPSTQFSFLWREGLQAFSLFFLQYVHHSLSEKKGTFTFQGTARESPAASLGDAICQTAGKLNQLFVEYKPEGGMLYRINDVFWGDNVPGKSKTDRSISVQEDYLPSNRVEIFWDKRPVDDLTKIDNLLRQFCRAWNFPESEKIKPPEPPRETAKPRKPALKPGKSAEPVTPVTFKAGSRPPTPRKQARKPETEADEEPEETEEKPKQARRKPIFQFEIKEPQRKVATPGRANESAFEPESEPAPVKPIDPRLFVVPPCSHTWEDEAPLLDFGDGEPNLRWKLRNAFEGILVMGATGSGKTSGSGALLSETFLRQGFGALVLTVKTDEANRWQKLCRHCGREQDFVRVSLGGEWKMNLLAYESQRLGRGAGLANNLVSLCRNLLAVSSRYQGEKRDSIWELAGDQLLSATFELFLIAGSPLTFDNLSGFIFSVPTEHVPNSEAGWFSVPVFGEILAKAKQSLKSAEDRRMYQNATTYWFKNYPTLAPQTRTSVTLGIYAMLDAFRGRLIPALISDETNFTPESIMAGKVVVLDLPLKEMDKTGVIIQSAIKYVVQTALERTARSGDEKTRPVVLWEDEAQYFFSEHDFRFQDTARSARVCRVSLTQNLPGFYKQFSAHGNAAADSVFANLNTKVFHANTDPQTNDFASKLFGSEIKMKYGYSVNPSQPAENFWGRMKNMIDPQGGQTNSSWNEQREAIVQPDEFTKLRNGGRGNNFMVDAYITWLGLVTHDNRNFIKTTFTQNSKL